MSKTKNVNILNKRARFEYEILEEYEAGIVLTGTEIKSIRLSKASITESFCEFINQELFVINMSIEEYKAVFIIGIGGKLSNGEKHDYRAPDYDDWVTANEDGFLGLNGDILLWNPVLNVPFEISSMGIRVDKNSLEKQLQIEDKEDRKELYFHKRLLNNELPLTIGGGIGQSRLCMFLLQKAHIGEIQASIWPEEMREKCKAHNIPLI